jgi:hypothetical protein
MKGEKLGWFQVASHLSIPVAELAGRITYSEFQDWIAFLQREEERNTKLDIYLAQIAAEVRRGIVKNPKSVKTKDFLMKKQVHTPSPEEKKGEARAARSKAIWVNTLNLKVKD